MPLIYITSPSGTFPDGVRDALAEELTVTALEAEKLPTTGFDKSTTWIYFVDVPPTKVFHGGQPSGTRVVSVEVNCFQGGLNQEAKDQLYKQFTNAIAKHAGFDPGERVPVYVVLREVDPRNWGVFGGRTSIEELRVAHPELAPI
jgi:phenylpyruvate tautomerase PptA (4-oxalocrotonate tautomerase family)